MIQKINSASFKQIAIAGFVIALIYLIYTNRTLIQAKLEEQ